MSTSIEEIVNEMIQNAIKLSKENSDYQQQQADKAFNAAEQLIIPTSPGEVPTLAKPTVLAPVNENLQNILKDANQSLRTTILNLLRSEWDQFVNKYYPTAVNDAANDWLLEVIDGTNPTGIPPEVEDAIWNRARDREQELADQASISAIEMHARLGWINPPGSLADQIKDINDQKDKKLCEINRDVAIDAANREQENIRFAIGQAVGQATGVLNAASNFISVLIGAYGHGNTYGGQVSEAAVDYYNQSIQFYTATIAAEEWNLKNVLAQIDVNKWIEEVVIDIFKHRATEMTNAALSAAQTAGGTAAAALAAQNTGGFLNVEEQK